MIRLTNLADYAVVLMSHFVTEEAVLMNAGCLSEKTGIPAPTVAKIMGAMARSGLLESQRGIKGGFLLLKDPSEISIADIIEAVEGPIALTNCLDESNTDCGIEPLCHLRPHWQAVNDAVRMALSRIMLADIAQDAARPCDCGSLFAGLDNILPTDSEARV